QKPRKNTRILASSPTCRAGRPSQIFSYATLVLALKRSGGLTYFSLASLGDLYSRIVAIEGYMPSRRVKFRSTLALAKDAILGDSICVYIGRHVIVLPLLGLVS